MKKLLLLPLITLLSMSVSSSVNLLVPDGNTDVAGPGDTHRRKAQIAERPDGGKYISCTLKGRNCSFTEPGRLDR